MNLHNPKHNLKISQPSVEQVSSEQLREGEKTDAVQFSCSCFAYNHKGSRIGYQQKRHCMRVLSHGIKENVVNIPDVLNIGVVAACPPPHRTASAGKALELDEY